MVTLLHASDLHFGPPYVPAVGEALLRAAHELRPDAIVVSGDFTQRAKPEQFRVARAYLDRLPSVPIICTPGNHDVPLYRVWERLTRPYQLYREHIDQRLDHVTVLPGAIVVALASTAPWCAITNGRLRRRQLDYAAQAFGNAPPETQRVLVIHHHLAPPPDFEGGRALPGARRVLDALAAMKVDLVLAGHMHRAYIGSSLDVYSGALREHNIVLVQCGTSTSRRGRAREREKNTFNLVRLDERRIRVTHYMYFDTVGRFLPLSHHMFYRGGRPPLENAELDEVVYRMTETR